MKTLSYLFQVGLLTSTVMAADIPGQGLVYEGEMVNGVLIRNANSGKRVSALGAQAASASAVSTTGTLDIILEPGTALSNNSAAMAAFERAAKAWEARIRTPITMRITADIAPLGAGILGGASGPFFSGTHDNVRDALVARATTAIVASLPTKAQLVIDIPVDKLLSDKIYMKRANAEALGFPTNSGKDSITFNNNYTFDYDNRNGVDPGLTDFESVAIHEIGHLLGFSSFIDQFPNNTFVAPTILDLFRFQDGVAGRDPATTAEFMTFPRYFVTGGNHIFDDATTEYALENGSGHQASHWLNGPNATCIGIMDPELLQSSAVPIKDSDWRALALIGWDVAPSGPQIVVEPVGAVSFGNVSRTSSTSITLTVKNTGSQPLNVSSIAVTGGHAAEFAVNTAGTLTTVPPMIGETTFTVTFTPGGYGLRSTSLMIINNDADPQKQTMTLSLSGNVPVPTPTLTSFTPTGGSIGSEVTLMGTGLDTATAVSFNGTPAQFVLDFDSRMLAVVPAGATSGPITVTTLGGTVTSAGSFTISTSASGFWSTRAWAGDSTTGIPATNSDANGHLVVALRFGSSTNTTVNGRLVEGLVSGQLSSYVRPSPSVWETYPSTSNSLTAQGGAGSAVMASSFLYGNEAQGIVLHSLDPGQRYRVSFFSVGFEGSGTRLVNFSSGTDQLVVDQSQFGLGNGIRVDYHFTASTQSQTINLNALNLGIGRTWHNYGIALVRVVPQPPTLTTLTATNVTANSAVLNGTVNANGSTAGPSFFYGINLYDNSKQTTPWPATGWGDTAVSATVTGLLGHQNYQFQLIGDNALGMSTGAVVNFTTPNSVPVANNMTLTAAEDSIPEPMLPVSDADGDFMTVTLVTPPAHGSVTVYPFAQPQPSVIYWPAANYYGQDSFQYRVTDGFGGTSATRTVNITLTSVNDLPTLGSIAVDPINEDAGVQTVSLSSISTGALNESQTLTVTATSNNPALIPNPTVTYASPSSTGSLSYTPVATAHGTAVITVAVSDGQDVTSQNFIVTVNPVNDAPSFTLPPSATPAGVVWTARESTREWFSIASSADGTKLAAVVNFGQIYTSTDSGVTWTPRDSGIRDWNSIASSSDGTKLAATVNSGRVYTSTDSGVTWTARGNNGNWKSMVSSSDGTKLAALDGQPYTSTDSGVTWTPRLNLVLLWKSIASSADGTKLAATVSNGQIYTSTNSGVTWVARASSRDWGSICSSADGTKLAATVSDGQIYTSADSGVTWTAQASGSRYWGCIATSADGTKLAAAGFGQICTSTDSGVTWTAQASGSRNWVSVAFSADGTKLAAVARNGQIYTSVAQPYGLSADSDSGLNTIANFATSISPGPANEAGQTVGFNVTNTNNALFAVQPAIASNGTLTFTPSGTATGTANVTVVAQDNGGVAFGGVDTGLSQTFTITVNLGVNDAPSFTLPPSGLPAGEVWTARDSIRNWQSIASSADGTKLAAGVDGGQIYTSTNSGMTWTAQASGSHSWHSIASSADGTKLAAAAIGGQIYTSTNSGSTWTAQASGSRVWRSIASSSDGTKLAAVVQEGQIYTSTNSGVTWTARESNRNWSSIASSADGTKLAAVVNTGLIYTSTDSGVSWTARNSNRSWTAIASSADGTKLAATVYDGQIYTSTDSGVTWTARDSPRSWSIIASSSDGTKLATFVNNGPIFTSTDSGVTWIARPSGSFDWRSIASSGDGTKLAAVADDRQIYTSVPAPYGLTVAANSGANATPSFATNISPGAANEAGQTVSFNLSNTNNTLFTVQPAIASNGTLTFTPNPSASGTATVTATAQDNGGVAFGGVDTSAPQTFTLTITSSAPLVTTPTVTNITATGATLGGDVTGTGGSAITARGVVYSLTAVNANPTLATGTVVTASGTTGVFTVNTLPLSVSSGYSFKAYATNSVGTTYTSVATFTTPTPIFAPTVITPTSTSITAMGAVLGGHVMSDGGATVTERGVVLSPSMMNPNPRLEGFGVVALTNSGTMGVFTVNAESLTPGTAYSFAAYATNSQGTSYTSTGTFSTPSNNADLAGLGLVNLSGPGGTYNGPAFGVLAPSFFSSTTSYITSVPSTFNSTSISVGIAQANQSVTVNGVPVTGLYTFSAGTSEPIPLVTGPNVITTVVTAQDGTTKTYTITVTRTAPPTVTSPTVADITTTGATLGGNITSTGFASLMDSGIVLSPTATNSNPQVNGVGVIKIPGGFGAGVFTVPATSLTPGVQYSFAAFATNNSEPGSTGYSLVSTFTTISNDASLSGLALSAGTLSPSFSSGTTFYMASVSNLTNTLTVTPTAQANATIRVNNVNVPTGLPSLPISLVLGANMISINVTAQDGYTSQFYFVNVTRLAPPTLGMPTTMGISGNGAQLQCPVSSDGGAPLTQRGVVYAVTSTNGTPRIGGSGVTQSPDGGPDASQISAFLFGLTPGTSYSFAAYATNSEGTTYSTAGSFTTLAPEIVVKGNAVIISDGDISPSLGDHTNFGNTATTGGTVVRTFTIQNTGGADLTLGSVVVGGADALSFTVTASPPPFVLAGQSALFQITFDPSADGLRFATLSFTTNDADENPFNFSIQGTAHSSAAEAEAANWAESYGLSAADAAPTATPFDDGVPNLLKYAFNMPLTGPNVSGLAPGTGSSGLPAITAPDTGGPPDSIRVEFIRRRNSGLIYTPLYSINGLSNFIPMTATPVVTTIDANWERVVVLQPLSLPLPTTTFSRVSVTAP